MSTRRLPNSNPTRYNALRTVTERITASLPANVPLTPATLARLNLLFPDYKAKYLAVEAGLTGQGSFTNQIKTAKQQGIYFTSDFIDAMQNAVRRGTFDASVRALYGLPITKPQRPEILTEKDVLDWGDQIHEGETARLAAGGAPITFPSLAEVDAAVNNFRTLNLQQAAAKDTYDNAQEALVALNTEADKVILKVWNEIETAFDEGNKASMRRRAREWGVTYIPTPGQAPSPDEFSITGKITEQGTNAPVNEAEILVVETATTVLSDSNGDYFIGTLPPGTYTLQITKALHEVETIPGVVVTAAAITTLNVSLAPVITINGTIVGTVTAAAIPVGGVTISVDGFPLITTLTSAGGNYTLANIPIGMQTIRAQMPAPGPMQTQTVNIVAGPAINVSFNF